MIPFPGESAPLDWANVTAGAPFADSGDAIRFRAGSATLTAGDAFVAGFYDHRYLEAGADAAFSAVVETLAGSSGTLSLTGGPDAAWSLGDANASAYDLGDHTVTGAQTIVVPLPWLTVADYLAETAETAVRVECTAGSVIVQQVKLRIWPTAGVGGGWSAPYSQPPQESNPQISTFVGGIVSISITTQAVFRSALAALTTSTTGVAGTNIAAGQMIAYDPTLEVGGAIGAAYVERPGGNLVGPGFEEESWIVPPNEVPGDDDRVIFQSTGDDAFSWVQPVATVVMGPTVLSGPDAYPAAGDFHIGAVDTATPVAPGTTFVSLATSSGVGTVAQAPGPLAAPGVEFVDAILPEFDDRLLVTVWHDGHFADIPATGGTQARLKYGRTTDEATFDRLTYRWTPAPYRYWNPAAPPVTPPLRQRNRDTIRARLRASRQRSIRARGYL